MPGRLQIAAPQGGPADGVPSTGGLARVGIQCGALVCGHRDREAAVRQGVPAWPASVVSVCSFEPPVLSFLSLFLDHRSCRTGPADELEEGQMQRCKHLRWLPE